MISRLPPVSIIERPLVEMSVAPAAISDSRTIATIHVDAWRAAYAGIVCDEFLAALSVDAREAFWRDTVRSGSPQVLVARTRDGIRGWTAFGACRDSPPADKTGEIWAIYVSPTSWHAGIGRVLMGDALNRLKAADYRSVALWVMAKNERAIRFYDSLGFKREVGSEREFELGGSWIAEARLSIDL